MAACSTPTSVSGGTVITSGPYSSGDIAVYQCTSGYVMSGTAYITCNAGAWSTSPSCVQTSSNDVTVNDGKDFDWLIYFIAALCGITALAILTCWIVCCLQMFGFYGPGKLFGEPRRGCCCRRRHNTQHCTAVPRKYETDEYGRRFHYNDLGERCYYRHRNRYVNNISTVTPAREQDGKISVITVNEVNTDKKQIPAKEINIWKPHSHPVRNINTSTK